MKKSVSLILISLILFSTFGILVLAKDNDSDNSGSSSDSTVEIEIGIESDDSTSSETNLATKGIVEFVDVEGGCWRIKGDDGTNYEATNLDSSFRQDGLKIRFEGEIREDMVSTCQVGTLITLKKIEIEDDSKETEIEIESENEIEFNDKGESETKTKEETKIKYANGTRVEYKYELREKTQLTNEQKERIIKARNELKLQSQTECPVNCSCAGSTIKCEVFDPENNQTRRELTIRAGNSGNIIVQVKGINASTNVTLYKSDDGRIYGVFKNNETRRILLPDEAKLRIEARLKEKVKVYNENITLNEEGTYQIRAEKQARLFWAIPVRERIHSEIDAETGEITKEQNSWWGFLAKDVEVESETEEQ